MDKETIQDALTYYINSFYPNGGYTAFCDDGGLFLVDPIIPDLITIYHPNIPKNFQALLQEKTPFIIKFVTSYNFQNVSREQIEESLHDTVHKIYKNHAVENVLVDSMNSLCLLITITGNLYEEEITEITEMFSKLKVNGVLFYMNHSYPFKGLVPDEINVNKNNEERGVITQDDIVNMIIDLNMNKDIFA